jgi:hypothetical protein
MRPWLQSPLLCKFGFTHGFTTRWGGISNGEFATWNFSPSTGDLPENVKQNYRILAEHLGVNVKQIHSVHQVHSSQVVELKPDISVYSQKADALLCTYPGPVVAIKTADCVPLLMADPISRIVAAVHAGWRGVVGHIAIRTLEHLRLYSPNASPLVAIGPHISACCFQVGSDVAQHFEQYLRPDPSTPDRFLVDLAANLRDQLLNAKIPASHIDLLPFCTKCDPQGRFFSHRRQHGICGRMLNFISSTQP